MNRESTTDLREIAHFLFFERVWSKFAVGGGGDQTHFRLMMMLLEANTRNAMNIESMTSHHYVAFAKESPWRCAVVFFLVHKMFIFALSLYYTWRFHPFVSYSHLFSFSLLDNFFRWDAIHYIRIAESGYSTPTLPAFFPLYPSLIWLVHTTTTLTPTLSGFLIGNSCLYLTLGMLLKTVTVLRDTKTAIHTLCLLICFPVAFFLSMPYTEPLFLLSVVTSCYFLLKGKVGWAGVFALIAALTRNTGFLLSLVILVEYAKSIQWNWRNIRWDILFAGLPIAGMLLWMATLWLLMGDPLAFTHAQHYWHRSFNWPWVTLWNGSLTVVRQSFHLTTKANPLAEAAGVYMTLGLLVPSFWVKKLQIPTSWKLYALGLILVPLTMAIPGNEFESFPRYTLVIFPSFLLLAMWLKSSRKVLACCGLFLGGQIYMFAKLTSGCFVG